MRRLILLLFALAAPAALAAQPASDANRVQAFVDRAAPVCATRPASVCVDEGWAFAATDPKRGLTPADVLALRDSLQAWFFERQAALDTRTKAALGFGLVLASAIGPDRVHGAFDTDRDGFVSRAELLADVRLDDRPLGVVLADPVAVDRAGLAARLGLHPAMIERLFR